MNDGYHQREMAFAESDDGIETDGVSHLIVAWGRLGERLIMNEAVMQRVMTDLYESALGRPADDHAGDWERLWECSPVDITNLRLTQLFTALKAYAFFGLWPDAEYFEVDGDGDIERIARVVGMGRDLLDSLPESWRDPGALDDILLAAEGRLALDTDTSLSADQLAALAQVGVRTVKNLTMPSSAHPLRLTDDGRIPASDALGWLQRRGGFHASIWRERDARSRAETVPDTTTIDQDEILFVPLARDGSIFEPDSCRWQGRYVIGSKGAEQHFEDYREALDALAGMQTPRWRRPTDKGSWRIVRSDGDRWLRRTAAELGLATHAGQPRAS